MSSGHSRDYVLFYVNGREHRVAGQLALMQLADYLRAAQGLCGTKVVCAEGDCGACSVLVGRVATGGKLTYKPLNSCILAIYQLDCAHVITVEGLTPPQSSSDAVQPLSPLQTSMVDCHGAQCGFCTPGFVVSLAALFDGRDESDDGAVTRESVKNALTGNLCRCTGYESIIKSALECDADAIIPLEKMYPPDAMLEAFGEHEHSDVVIESGECRVCIPHSLEAAAQFKHSNQQTTVVSGGTDVCVNINKRGFKPTNVLSICNLRGLDDLKIVGDSLHIGARINLEQLSDYVKDKIPELYKMLWLFGAPQIRYAGTMAGNIANGSPIGDTLPFLFVMEAQIEVHGVHGTRRIPVCSFYKGYKKMDLAPDELITRIIVPVPLENETLRLFKVSKRQHLDISSFAAAFLIATDSGGTDSNSLIKYSRVALGGVGPTTLRMPATEEFLKGKHLSLETFEKAGLVALTEITPISDVRGSSDFRNQLAENMFLKFYCSMDQPETLCTV